MSVWVDIMRRSLGEIARKEDLITEKKQLSGVLEERLEKGTEDLASILAELRMYLSSFENETLFTIEDVKLLSEEEMFLLQASLILPFILGKYKSLEELLTEQKVRVVIDSNEPKNENVREVPSELEKAKAYWEDKVCKNPNDEFARRMLGEIKEEIAKWRYTLIRGLYRPSEKVILLFPNNMKKEYGGKRMNELLVSTLVHEAMHAYFDRIPLNELPYVYSLEEPMAEFGMLLYLKETNQNAYYTWARDDVGSKKSCYRYGVALMDQCVREGSPSQTRRDLELYKMFVPVPVSTTTVSASSTSRGRQTYEIRDKATSRLLATEKGMGKTVLFIIRRYCSMNPGISFAGLQSVFGSISHHSSGSMGIIELLATVNAYKTAHSGDPRQRFYEQDPINLSNGDVILVSSQWAANGTRANFGKFKTIADSLGYIII